MTGPSESLAKRTKGATDGVFYGGAEAAEHLTRNTPTAGERFKAPRPLSPISPRPAACPAGGTGSIALENRASTAPTGFGTPYGRSGNDGQDPPAAAAVNHRGGFD